MITALQDEGIIIKKYLLRETSYIVVIYTKEHGKIRGVIKGIRKPYPQFSGDLEIFTRCEVSFYRKKKKGLDLISSCKALTTFMGSRKDILRLTYANYFIELVDIVTADYDEDALLYDILLKALDMLSSDASPRRIARIFELKLLEAVGMAPVLEGCSLCGDNEVNSSYFNPASGGVVCRKCFEANPSAGELSQGSIKFMNHIKVKPIEETKNIKVSKKVGEEIEKTLAAFIEYHIGKEIKTKAFIKKLNDVVITTAR